MNEAAFWASIAEGDDVARLALADWLADRDDPRAAWVRDADICRHMLPDGRDPVPVLVAALPQEKDDAETYWTPGGEEVAAILARLGPAALPAARCLTRLTILYDYAVVEYDWQGYIVRPLGSHFADDALTILGPACVPDVLAEVARTKHPRYTRASRALSRMANTITPTLRKALRRKHRVRGVAALALAAVDPAAALPVLVAALREECRAGHPGDAEAYIDAIARAAAHVAPCVAELQEIWEELDDPDRQRLAERHPAIGTGDLPEARRLLAQAAPALADRDRARRLIAPHLDSVHLDICEPALRLLHRLEELERC